MGPSACHSEEKYIFAAQQIHLKRLMYVQLLHCSYSAGTHAHVNRLLSNIQQAPDVINEFKPLTEAGKHFFFWREV